MFRAIGSTGSLAAAARLMDLTPPALTIRLKKLEDKLGVLLAVRGARGISLTEEGQRLLEEALEVLKQIDTLPERIAGEAHAMNGHLRVVAPFGFGRQHVAAIVGSLHLAHPGLTVALTLSEHPLREAAANDVVVNIGPVKDSSWVGHLLAPNDRWLCASPAYLRRLGEPLSHPSQLERHACLCLKENEDDLTRWRFSATGTADLAMTHKVVTVRVAGALSSNDGTVISQWAEGGLGIMVRSEWEAAPLVASGRLVRLLPQWQLEPAPVMALVPTRKGASARLRHFVEAARAALHPVPWRHKLQRP